VGAGELGFGSGGDGIEHVQIISLSRSIVKKYFERVQIRVQLSINYFIFNRLREYCDRSSPMRCKTFATKRRWPLAAGFLHCF
jgi:hypothetical protein